MSKFLDIKKLEQRDRTECSMTERWDTSVDAIAMITYIGEDFGFAKIVDCLSSFSYQKYKSFYFRLTSVKKVGEGIHLPILSSDPGSPRIPQKGDMILCVSGSIYIKRKGPELKKWWFHDEYLAVEKMMSARPEYRAMETKTFLSGGVPATTQPKVVWQGFSLAVLNEKYPRKGYDELASCSSIDDMNYSENHWFEKREKDEWKRCEDPRSW